MGFPTKIQLIKRAKSEQWYINFPSALAQAMEFDKGEIVEWLIENKQKLILKRNESSKSSGKKKLKKQIP
jgi:antitoxin component of MazEF toxin-antitoxin module